MSIYHKHHIIPKHMGGTDDPSNLVELTIEEHAEAHRKLFEKYGHWEDELAWKGLSGSIGKEKIILTKIVKANLGKKDSKETRKKKSDAQKRIGNTPPSPLGRKDSDSTKEKKRLGRIGKKASAETIEKMRNSHIGQKAWNAGTIGIMRPNKGSFEFGYKHDNEAKKKLSSRKWITDGVNNIFVPEHKQIGNWIPNGYRLGRTKYWTR